MDRMSQKAARTAQKATGCSYSQALMYARMPEVHEAARADQRDVPFRTKFADAVVKRLEGRKHGG